MAPLSAPATTSMNRSTDILPCVHPNAAGLDIGADVERFAVLAQFVEACPRFLGAQRPEFTG